MIFVNDTPIKKTIKGIDFFIKPLSGVEVIQILGKNGFENFSKIDGSTAAELIKASIVEFVYKGQKYQSEHVDRLKADIYSELLNAVIDLNFGVDTNFQKTNE